jgi:hypothetical protein
MAHFFKPQGSPPADYDVDGRLAPDSIWRVRIPVGATRRVGLWGGRNLWVRLTWTGKVGLKDTIFQSEIFERSDEGDLTFLEVSPESAGDYRLEAGLGQSTWVTLQVEAGGDAGAQAGDLNAATQRGTYQNIDEAAVVRHFHQGKSGIELLGGLSRGYMRWLEIAGPAVRTSSGPPPGAKPSRASLPWTTYSERPKLIVVRQGWTFPTPDGSVRHYLLEVWWLPSDDTEYQVLAGHAGRAEHGDPLGYGMVMRPFAGDVVLFEMMKRELAATIGQLAGALIVSAAIWKLSTRSAAPSGPVPPEAAASLGKKPPTRPGVRVLVVGPETETEFDYAQKVNASGGKATAVNPVRTAAADRFVKGGGEFVEGSIDKLPQGAQYDIIREDYPYPTGNFVDTASANARISRLKPGGSWVVVTEKADFANTLEAAAAMQGAKVMRNVIPQFHEGTPVSGHPKDAGRIVVIITKQ